MNTHDELKLNELYIAECEKKLKEAQKYGNYGDMQHWSEQIRWTKHEIKKIEEGIKVV